MTDNSDPSLYHVVVWVGYAPVVIPVEREGTDCDRLKDEVGDLLYGVDGVRYLISVVKGRHVAPIVSMASDRFDKLRTLLEEGLE